MFSQLQYSSFSSRNSFFAISILLSDLILNAIHFLKPFQIRRSLNQHHFLDLSRMKILETGNLLAVADALP